MFRRPGIQTQTFKYVESSFGMRNSNLGERNVIVVSVTSTGEDPNTYPIVPKGKNFQTKKALHEPVTMSLCTTHFIYIYIISYRSSLHQRRKTWKKSHALQGGTAINTHLSYLQKRYKTAGLRRMMPSRALKDLAETYNFRLFHYIFTPHPTTPMKQRRPGRKYARPSDEE